MIIVYTMYIQRGGINMPIITIQKWGNSQGIRIPKSILKAINWKANEELSIYTENDKIIIEPAKKRKNIVELFENYDGEYKPVEMEWGDPVGEEIW